MIWKCQTVTGIFNRNNGTNATQKQKPQTIKSKLVVWDFCFCRIYFLSCAWHTGGAGRGNGYASSGMLPENPGNAGSGNRAESAFPLYKVWSCTRIRVGNTSTHSTVVNFKNTESFNPCNPCPERATVTTTALNSEKHPWWILNDSILIQCPENWVHIGLPGVFNPEFYRTSFALPLMMSMAPSWQVVAHKPQPLHFSSSIWMIFRIISILSCCGCFCICRFIIVY